MELILVAAAAVLQFAAAIVALRLIRTTGGRAAWMLIAAAMCLQALRRCVTLARLAAGGSHPDVEVADSWIALTISALMLVGVAGIAPLFLSIKRDKEELRKSNALLNAALEEREKLIAQLQEALASIRTLRGLVPICASCKKIRDAKGCWQQIESYVRDHSEAEFSHGICPECSQKLYPDFKQGQE